MISDRKGDSVLCTHLKYYSILLEICILRVFHDSTLCVRIRMYCWERWSPITYTQYNRFFTAKSFLINGEMVGRGGSYYFLSFWKYLTDAYRIWSVYLQFSTIDFAEQTDRLLFVNKLVYWIFYLLLLLFWIMSFLLTFHRAYVENTDTV